MCGYILAELSELLGHCVLSTHLKALKYCWSTNFLNPFSTAVGERRGIFYYSMFLCFICEISLVAAPWSQTCGAVFVIEIIFYWKNMS